MRSIFCCGNSAFSAVKAERAFAVKPPPQGFSQGARGSMRVTGCPCLARRIAAHKPAGPAPITLMFILNGVYRIMGAKEYPDDRSNSETDSRRPSDSCSIPHPYGAWI